MKIDGSGQRKTQRGVCSRAHGKRDPFDTSYCVAKRSSDRSLTRRPCPQMLQWHPRVAKGASGRSLARPPCPQVLQRHPGVAKGASGRSLARRPCPQVPQSHPRVAKGVLFPPFGTATLPTDAPGASLWSHCELVYRIVALLGFVKFTWYEPLLIIK